jgi:tetratricopeptide (TPR) repeat protein
VLAYYQDNANPTEHARLRAGLEHAVKSDPDYATAWACLCAIYLDEHRARFNPLPNPLDRALDAARRAVDSDPRNQYARQVLAATYFYRHESDAFIAEVERAIALNPNNASVLGYLGEKLHFAGDARGIELIRRAMVLNPFLPTILNLSMADYHFHRGEFEEALAATQKLDAPGGPKQVFLAAIYAALGRKREATSALQKLLELYPGFTSELLIRELEKNNFSDDRIRSWVAALRKAGLPE